MTETERMFVFTALAILIGDYLRRMFPPLAWWIIIPILHLGDLRPVHSECATNARISPARA